MNEAILRLGGQESLVGIVTEPNAGTARRRVGVILLNAWRVHRVGPHRLYVELARRLAANGFVVVRLDLSGIGDSPARRDGMPEAESTVLEAREAMGQVRDEYDLDGFVLAGICSGASVALWAISEDRLAVGAALINLVAWDPDDDVNDAMSSRAATGYYLGKAVFDRQRWRRLLSGRSAYGQIGRALLARVRSLFRRTESRGGDVAAERLEQIEARGAHLALIFSEGDRSIDVARQVLGEGVQEQHEGHVRTYIVPRTDHLFTLERSRDELYGVMEGWLLEVAPG